MNYDALIQTLAEVHQQAQSGAARATNHHHVMRNWLVGAYLVEFEQSGEDRAKYCTGLLKKVSSDLASRKVSGCSRQMLERMRQLYLLYPQLAAHISSPPVSISSSTVTKSPPSLPPALLLRFSWSQFIEFLSIDDPWKRAFYENECLKGNWAKRDLQRQIGSLLYGRTGLSTDKQTVLEHARQQALEAPADMAELIRDPYVLEFVGLAEKPHYLERDLETALLDHLQTFLLELGTGFCFEARQERLTVGDEHDYIDLVFYHRILRCHRRLAAKSTFRSLTPCPTISNPSSLLPPASRSPTPTSSALPRGLAAAA